MLLSSHHSNSPSTLLFPTSQSETNSQSPMFNIHLTNNYFSQSSTFYPHFPRRRRFPQTAAPPSSCSSSRNKNDMNMEADSECLFHPKWPFSDEAVVWCLKPGCVARHRTYPMTTVILIVEYRNNMSICDSHHTCVPSPILQETSRILRFVE
jgi:hypothetical protein